VVTVPSVGSGSLRRSTNRAPPIFNKFPCGNRRLLRSTRAGVTCHPYFRRQRRLFATRPVLSGNRGNLVPDVRWPTQTDAAASLAMFRARGSIQRFVTQPR
jgi:hypothetical protein